MSAPNGSIEDPDGEWTESPQSSPDPFAKYLNFAPRYPTDDLSLNSSNLRYSAPLRSPYPHPLDGLCVFANAMTYKETYVRSFSAAVRNKPSWTEKILDRKLFAKWLREAQQQAPLCDGGEHRVLTWDEKDVNYAHNELVNVYKPFVEGLREAGMKLEPDVDGVWREDEFVDEDLRMELINAVATLENTPKSKRDWHPGSNKKVLDLVHPSLWPIIYGRTLSIQTGDPIKPAQRMGNVGFSQKFCWLPSEFEVSPSGDRTTIKSYINNLSSPSQKSLFYPILEKIFTKFVPLFNHVLGDLKMGKHNFRRVFATGEDAWWSDGLIELTNENHEIKWEKLLNQFINGEELNVNFSERMPHVSKRFDADGLGDPEFEGCNGSDDSDDEEINQRGNPNIYEVRENMGGFINRNWEPPKITEDVKLEGKTLKVIVKLANIILTPKKPMYRGGSWHVEAIMKG
ncbi:hypothetical protein TWF718_010084 [Orbilia javanica]|uniref:Uncharacterized protein n=1 Tax=Orbilia javanica TaxID=47235 RepID=A0AAN8MPS8_9PEZI